jgi:VWFA-related protein
MNQLIVPSCGKLGRFVGTALAVLLGCATIFPTPIKAQQSPPQEVSTRNVEPTFKLQAERNMVTVRVVVRNKQGEVIDNLRREDFQLFDRGKKQIIVQFSVEKPAPNAAEKPAPSPSPPEPGAPQGPPPAFILPRRFVALYFDDVNTGMSGLARTRDAADRFLKTSLHPGDRVGVFTASGQKPLDFTNDLAKVHQALFDLRPHPLIAVDEMCGAITPFEAYLVSQLTGFKEQNNDVITLLQTEKSNCCGGCPPPSPDQIRMEAYRVQAETEKRATIALQGIESLVRVMTTLPGQRSLVFISDGFLSQTLGDALSRLADRALHANIVINALDARGLFVGSMLADASVAGRDLPPGGPMESLKERLLTEEAMADSGAMGTLAQDTGGILYENNNDLEAGFRRVAATPDTYYTLAFSPENLKHDGAYHPLKVTLVSAKGLSVQARKGYYAPKKAEDLAAQEKEDIQEAAFSTNEMQGLPIQVNMQFFMLNKTDAEIDVVTHINLQQVHFRKEGDRNLDNLTLATAVFDRDGNFIAGQQKVLELRLRDQSLAKFLQTGVRIESELNVKPGTYLIRTVVRDSESGQISALNRTLEIPY